MKEKLSETTFSERGKRGMPDLLARLGGLLSVYLFCGFAFAQTGENRETYEIFMTAARKLYAASQYKDAIEQFEKAFAAFPDPKIYFNLAQSHRMLNEDAKALDYYEKFLAAIPTIAEFSPVQKKNFTREVEKKILEMKQRLNPDAPRTAGDGVAGGPPNGHGTPTRVPAGDPPNGEGTPTPAGDPALTARWWFWAGVGATALLTAGTVWAGLETLSANDRWEEQRVLADRDRAMRYQDLTDLCLAGAVAGAVAVTVSSVIWKRRNRARMMGTTSRVSLLPGSGNQGWMLTLSWDF